MDLKELFDGWGNSVKKTYADRQWLLSKWETVEGIVWPEEKIAGMLANIADGLQLCSGDRLVDLGCGGGWIVKGLSGRVGKAVGLDFSLPMLDNAREICDGIPLVGGALGHLPFKNESVEKALSYFVFLNFMDDEFVGRALMDVYRILKKGGRALIGQLPDKIRSADYDRAKAAYLDFCRRHYALGKSNREVYQAPQKLFDREWLQDFLRRQQVAFELRDSFNPFYRSGEPPAVNWRFDLILKK